MHAWDKAQGLKAFLGVQGGLAPTPQSQKADARAPPTSLSREFSLSLFLLGSGQVDTISPLSSLVYVRPNLAYKVARLFQEPLRLMG